jgi:hypothetical protein
MNFTDVERSTYSRGKAKSDCGRYAITWGTTGHGRYYNGWFGESPRKHLSGSYDRELVVTVCEQHKRMYQQPRPTAA